MMGDGKIYIPARRKKPERGTQVIRVSEDAYNTLVDIYNESSLSMAQIASKIIVESIDRIVYDKEEN
ncbi:MAG: hypothetical protein FWE25_03445 [Lachnospiraceae bacterium]|nr:hypothetical protein [Lachnospiraceae bacterium]